MLEERGWPSANAAVTAILLVPGDWPHSPVSRSLAAAPKINPFQLRYQKGPYQ